MFSAEVTFFETRYLSPSSIAISLLFQESVLLHHHLWSWKVRRIHHLRFIRDDKWWKKNIIAPCLSFAQSIFPTENSNLPLTLIYLHDILIWLLFSSASIPNIMKLWVMLNRNLLLMKKFVCLRTTDELTTFTSREARFYWWGWVYVVKYLPNDQSVLAFSPNDIPKHFVLTILRLSNYTIKFGACYLICCNKILAIMYLKMCFYIVNCVKTAYIMTISLWNLVGNSW